MRGMNNNPRYPRHRAAIAPSAPVGKAVAVVRKTRAFDPKQKSNGQKHNCFLGKTGSQMLLFFNLAGFIDAKTGKSVIQMPIAQHPS
jgi:hypothetical protein